MFIKLWQPIIFFFFKIVYECPNLIEKSGEVSLPYARELT